MTKNKEIWHGDNLKTLIKSRNEYVAFLEGGKPAIASEEESHLFAFDILVLLTKINDNLTALRKEICKDSANDGNDDSDNR